MGQMVFPLAFLVQLLALVQLLLLLWLLFLWFLLCLFLLWLSGHFVIFLGIELSFFFAHGDVTNN